MSPALVLVCVWSVAGAPQSSRPPPSASATSTGEANDGSDARTTTGDAEPKSPPPADGKSKGTAGKGADGKSAEGKSAEGKSADGDSAAGKGAAGKGAASKGAEDTRNDAKNAGPKSAPRRGPPPSSGPPPAPEAFARVSPPTRDLTLDDVHWTAWTGAGVTAGAVAFGIATITTVVIGGVIAANIGEGGRANEDINAALRNKAAVDITTGILAFSTAASLATGVVFGGYGLALLEDTRRQDAPEPLAVPSAGPRDGLGEASSTRDPRDGAAGDAAAEDGSSDAEAKATEGNSSTGTASEQESTTGDAANRAPAGSSEDATSEETPTTPSSGAAGDVEATDGAEGEAAESESDESSRGPPADGEATESAAPRAPSKDV